MYFIGFGLMGNLNVGIPFPWKELIGPFSLSHMVYTVTTVLAAHFIVFRRFYQQRPIWKLVLALALLLTWFILFRYLLEEVIFPATLGYGNYNPKTTFRYYVVDNIYFGSIAILIGFVFFLLDEMFRNQKRQSELIEQNKQAELNFLQAQMNPHFLFNSLNNIYSLAYEQNPHTAQAVLKLSDMMRYVTYQRSAAVTLANEMEYVHSLIDIEQLRHDHKLQIRIDISPEAAQAPIIPLLLIPLVENALKYGDLSDPADPCTLQVSRKDKKLHVMVRNRVSAVRTSSPGGVGLQNLQRRLELSYTPGSWQYRVEKEEQHYTTYLSIPA